LFALYIPLNDCLNSSPFEVQQTIESMPTYDKVFHVKKLFLLVCVAVLLCGCQQTLEADFFRIKLPDGFVRNEIGEAIPAKIVCSLSGGKINLINDIASGRGYVTFDWRKGKYAQGEATSTLGIGTLPDASVKTSKGTKPFGGILSWEETVVVMDSTKKTELRWLYHVAMPFDGGLLDIIFSIMPDMDLLGRIHESMSLLEVTDKDYFSK
jgi:hypothetical protein